MKSDDTFEFLAGRITITVDGETIGTMDPESVELVSPGRECEEIIYSRKDPCAGPNHVCDRRGSHEEHECFCGFTWGEEEIEKALSLSRDDFATFVRYQEGLG